MKNVRKTEDYQMKDYGKKSCFASFLPGIAGVHGIPIWCYYVNRGQGVVSFGVDHKDHAIMEFYPAHVAYQNVKRTGFRTFIRTEKTFAEAFSNESNPHNMIVGMNQLTIEEDLRELGLGVQVQYFTLPEESVGALVRRVSITNNNHESLELEIMDGMPAVIPYGVGIDSMKNMTQTAKAWMQFETVEEGVSYFRVRASMDDTAAVSMVEGGNFAFAVTADGARMPITCDPDAIFAYDNSLAKPVNFMEGGIAAVDAEEENTSNLLPCAFFAAKKCLEAGQTMTFYEIIGQVERMDSLKAFLAKQPDGSFFEKKLVRANELVDTLTENIATKTGDPKFDAYCAYTYMDNVLRGGFPIPLGHNKIFYVYSRKHGDLERDYNYFAMAPEFFSQGNGNFRDVNQNRRLDTFFSPFVGRENIHLFYSLVQLDGYNPLGIEKLTYRVDEKKAKVVLDTVAGDKEEILAFLTKPFTPGSLYSKLSTCVQGDVEPVFTALIDFATPEVNGNFGEGYWSDHWDYNLDLIEEYLAVFPEQEKEMLYEKAYGFFLSQVNINPRAKRYAITEGGVRQYYALNEASKRKTKDKQVKADFGEGAVIYTTLMEKLVLLCAAKFAALDPYGMGVEMEGGKPGWYDALNGLPGMMGSSMAETYELARNLDYTIGALMRHSAKVELQEDIYDLLVTLGKINAAHKAEIEKDDLLMDFWNEVNDAKEAYREKTFAGISGKVKTMASEELASLLLGFRETVRAGINKAVAIGTCPTYFTYEVTSYTQDEAGIHPEKFEVRPVPLFLEGPVRYLKLEEKALSKDKLYDFVKHSDLYDDKLSMYKVNASLTEASYELGRCRSFTPGWLENESIWLHMEYKYLLELIKSGLYKEFAEDFHKAVIPFLDEETYGRSILENSSFIASSKNPNKKIHGKGFVARLSGSTVEFLSMWKMMMFGARPFTMEDELSLTFAPTIPSYLIGEDKTIGAMLLGKCQVTYTFEDQGDFFPGNYRVEKMQLTYKNKAKAQVNGAVLHGRMAEDVREGLVTSIEVKVVRA